MKRTCVERFDFRGAYAPPLTASRLGKWAKADTSAAGSPTVQTGSSGAMELTQVNTNEAENLCLYYGDVLPYDIDDLVRFEMWVAVTASLNAAISAAWGLTGARNDAIDSIAQAALFRVIGNNNVDVATGETLSTTFKRFVIDFSAGNLAQSPPSRSLGGTADVRFHIGNSAGLLRRVAAGTRFNMSNYTGGLQPFFQIQKTADAATGVLYVLGGEIEYRLPL